MGQYIIGNLYVALRGSIETPIDMKLQKEVFITLYVIYYNLYYFIKHYSFTFNLIHIYLNNCNK